LNASAAIDNRLAATSLPEYEGREVERWLKGVRVSAREVDVSSFSPLIISAYPQKPSLLHALVLHLIKHERFRHALDELETYVSLPFP
jgi:RNA polymerase I-specific transcription initiation factor RRN11